MRRTPTVAAGAVIQGSLVLLQGWGGARGGWGDDSSASSSSGWGKSAGSGGGWGSSKSPAPAGGSGGWGSAPSGGGGGWGSAPSGGGGGWGSAPSGGSGSGGWGDSGPSKKSWGSGDSGWGGAPTGAVRGGRGRGMGFSRGGGRGGRGGGREEANVWGAAPAVDAEAWGTAPPSFNPPVRRVDPLTLTAVEVNIDGITKLVGQRVQISGIADETTWHTLKDHLRQVGEVSFCKIFSGGRAMVEFTTPEEAARAISELQGSELEGATMFLREDREDTVLINTRKKIREARDAQLRARKEEELAKRAAQARAEGDVPEREVAEAPPADASPVPGGDAPSSSSTTASS